MKKSIAIFLIAVAATLGVCEAASELVINHSMSFDDFTGCTASGSYRGEIGTIWFQTPGVNCTITGEDSPDASTKMSGTSLTAADGSDKAMKYSFTSSSGDTWFNHGFPDVSETGKLIVISFNAYLNDIPATHDKSFMNMVLRSSSSAINFININASNTKDKFNVQAFDNDVGKDIATELSANAWHNFRIEIDSVGMTYTVKIDGETKASDYILSSGKYFAGAGSTGMLIKEYRMSTMAHAEGMAIYLDDLSLELDEVKEVDKDMFETSFDNIPESLTGGTSYKGTNGKSLWIGDVAANCTFTGSYSPNSSEKMHGTNLSDKSDDDKALKITYNEASAYTWFNKSLSNTNYYGKTLIMSFNIYVDTVPKVSTNETLFQADLRCDGSNYATIFSLKATGVKDKLLIQVNNNGTVQNVAEGLDAGNWYNYKIVIDTENKVFSLKVDGITVAQNLVLQNKNLYFNGGEGTKKISEVRFSESTTAVMAGTTLYLDDMWIGSIAAEKEHPELKISRKYFASADGKISALGDTDKVYGCVETVYSDNLTEDKKFVVIAVLMEGDKCVKVWSVDETITATEEIGAVAKKTIITADLTDYTLTENARLKLMVWDSLSGMRPETDTETISNTNNL